MAPDTVLLPVCARQTLAVINFICFFFFSTQSLPSSLLPRLLRSPPSLPKPFNLDPSCFFRFRRQCKLLQPAAKNY